MAKVFKTEKMGQYMKGTEATIKPTAKEDSFMQMETCMKGIG
jgi:hypothetical protein